MKLLLLICCHLLPVINNRMVLSPDHYTTTQLSSTDNWEDGLDMNMQLSERFGEARVWY